ncbi:hypothetical protein DFH29DRAFT_878003 [Suillus ampliporus]|nr:hypothetical protein DFH29DRAFT_878003 [Suillus ampliporus]
MGKFNHINELLGADSYPSWRRAIRLVLAGEGLWNHCSSGTDPNDIAKYMSSMLKPVTAGQPTADELKLMKERLKEDAQTKAIIGRKLSPIVQNILDEGLSAREQWEMLSKRFAHLDDTEDTTQYLGVFENGRRHFTEMRITFTDKEAIFMLLNGLPNTPQWVVFCSLTIGLYSSTNIVVSSSTTTTSSATSISFEQVTTSFTEEANHQQSHLKMAHPGSEYTNTANAASWGPDRKASNPTISSGGGMEGKVPWAQKGKPKKDVTASATEMKGNENTPATATTQMAASAISSESTHHQNLSFAVIEEVDQDYSHLALRSTSTILDSGTTWTYSQNSSIKVKTANHGYLSTSGRGDCVADLVINGNSFRIRLTDCLHAPDAYINLLSISRMLKKVEYRLWVTLSHYMLL